MFAVSSLASFLFTACISSESLQEVSVLLDTLRIAKNQHYLKVMQVAQPNEDNRSGDALNKAKSFLWVSHRKVKRKRELDQELFQAFFEALNVLEVATKARQNSNVVERPIYFNELKTMRESWRIRKVNDFVFGDLGYRICKCFKTASQFIWLRWSEVCTG